MTRRLEKSLLEQKQQTKQEVLQIPGILGIPLGGQRLVEVPDRNAYVYVRLRNSQNEIIQAFNNQVAPSYNLPVLVERQGNRYVVIGVDTQRYENNWNSFAPFLPRHGNTHSFDIESGGGGDIVWVYPRQFMPALVLPSGSAGGPNVVMAPYTLKNDNGTWKYVGNTGTQNITTHRPSSPTGAVMGLVYLNTTDGNPYFFINSGTVFLNSITGASQISPYIPTVTDSTTQIPLAAVRLITGTNILSWDNIYDVRQFIHNSPSGTGGGGSITVQDEGVSQGTATTFNFVGDSLQATVSGGTARIFVTGSASSINTGTLDSRYLKLDASNDPVTGELIVRPLVGSAGAYALQVVGIDRPGFYAESKSSFVANFVARQNVLGIELDHEASGTTVTNPSLYLARYPTYSGAVFTGPFMKFEDASFGFDPKYYGPTIQHIHSGTSLFQLHPNATGTLIPYIYDTRHAKPAGSILASWRSQEQEKAYLDVSGTFHSNGTPLVKEAPTVTGSYVRSRAGWNPYIHYLPFGVYTNTSPIGEASSPAFPYGTTVERTLNFVKWAQGVFVSTTNNGSNYWTIELIRWTDNSVIASVSTSASAADTHLLLSTTTFSIASITTSFVGIIVRCTKTGTPGNLFIVGPMLEVSV